MNPDSRKIFLEILLLRKKAITDNSGAALTGAGRRGPGLAASWGSGCGLKIIAFKEKQAEHFQKVSS